MTQPETETSPAKTRLLKGLPFRDYLGLPHWSQSSLKAGRRSMLRARHAFEGKSKPPTDPMILGSALHCAFLEPERMPERVICWEGGPRRSHISKDGKKSPWLSFQEQHTSQAILTPGFYANLIGMTQALRQHPSTKQWLSKIEDVEVSAIGDVNGLTMKARVDALTAEPLIDLKSCADVSERAMQRQAFAMGYHIQAWVYCELFDRERFVLLCVENTPPHDVVPWEFTRQFIDMGGETALELIDRVLECQKSGVWPGVSQIVQLLQPPEWALPKSKLTIGGEDALGEIAEADPLGLGEERWNDA